MFLVELIRASQEPFDGNTDQPLRYTLGRYDFEVHFEDETHGTQTNLTTGKVRRIQCLRKGEPVPTWEGTLVNLFLFRVSDRCTA